MNVSYSRYFPMALAFGLSLGLHAAEKPADWTDKQLDAYSDMQQQINPAAESPAHKVRALYPGQTSYTVDQIKIALHPVKIPEAPRNPKDHKQTGKGPDGSFTAPETMNLLNAYKQTQGSSADFEWALHKFFGVQDWYTPPQIAYVETNVDKAPPKNPNTPEAIAAAQKADKARKDAIKATLDLEHAEQARSKYYWDNPSEAFLHGFQMPKIRASWRDVLAEEDPSQSTLAQNPATVKDVVGAKISYLHNGNAGSDTWSTTGALILPWFLDLAAIRPASESKGFTLDQIAFAPSISINRVDTNSRDPKGEMDSLMYRLGVYTSWSSTEGTFAVETRAAAVYATDTGGHGRLPGFELDVEPRIMNDTLPLGYKKILRENPLFDKSIAPSTDPSAINISKSLWDVSLRVWLHMEGGDVQDNGKTWDPTKGEFFRMGPSVQFQMNFPQARLFGGQDFSINALYSCLPALSGSNEHENYFKVSAVWDLYNHPETNRKVALTADYEWGGLNFTKEDVNQVTIGLAVKF